MRHSSACANRWAGPLRRMGWAQVQVVTFLGQICSGLEMEHERDLATRVDDAAVVRAVSTPGAPEDDEDDYQYDHDAEAERDFRIVCQYRRFSTGRGREGLEKDRWGSCVRIPVLYGARPILITGSTSASSPAPARCPAHLRLAAAATSGPSAGARPPPGRARGSCDESRARRRVVSRFCGSVVRCHRVA